MMRALKRYAFLLSTVAAIMLLLTSSVTAQTYSVNVSSTAVAPGGTITVSWQAPSTHGAQDWVGLFAAGSSAFIAWKYVPSGTSGTMTFTAPQTAAIYELRYLLNNGYTVATRSTITVTTAASSSSTSPTSYTVTGGPTTVAPGGTITVSWQAPSTHGAQDWVGLFAAGSSAFTAWKYVPSGRSGTMTFTAPQTAAIYELRYLLNNGYTVAARSSNITVTAVSTNSTAASATLTWALSTSSDVVGYKVYQSTASGQYGAPIATLSGNATTYQATGLQFNTTYYFVVTAYDGSNNESVYSAEVSKSIY